MTESTKPAQCRDEDWNLARDCGLMAATPGTNAWDAALGRFANGVRDALPAGATSSEEAEDAAYFVGHAAGRVAGQSAQPVARTNVLDGCTHTKWLVKLPDGMHDLYTRPQVSAQQSRAATDALAERRRQVEAEGWTPEHDDVHSNNDMALAAAAYALHVGGQKSAARITWPQTWSLEWFKPTTARRDLVKAGALILAEIERIDRAENTASIAAKSAANTERAQIIARAVVAHGRNWPEQLTSGVMFYEGERITKAEFLAEVRA